MLACKDAIEIEAGSLMGMEEGGLLVTLEAKGLETEAGDRWSGVLTMVANVSRVSASDSVGE